MTHRTLIASFLSAGVLLGCDEPEPKPVPKAEEPTAKRAVTEKSTEIPTKAEVTKMAIGKVLAATQPAVAKAEELKDATVAKVAELKESIEPTAQKYYDQTKALIAKQDLAQAKDYVAKLDALRSQLPAKWQAKVDELKSSLAEATKGEMMPK